MNPAIQADQVCFSWNRKEALLISTLSLVIEKGSITAVLGPNGVGKTTFLRVLLGIFKPESGSIFFDGKQAGTIRPHQMKQMIGMVSQDESAPFDMRVADYVLLGRAPHKRLLEIPGKSDRQKALDALEVVGMMYKKDKGITQLSSGERQLVNIARALAQAPDILLLDEPCSHLDLVNTRRVLDLIRTISQSGKTIVFTSHDPNSASAVADTVLLMHKGRPPEQGTPDQMLTGERLTRVYRDNIEVIQTKKGPLVLAV